ncbi:MAG: prepilin-type N-terminal cleavage/methylation domain-containing protein [Candidatus Paceibacterota bacterium]|jgi:Tfp pilus assembly protein PilV
MTSYKLQVKKGFTLVETLVAVLIFTVSILALISLTATGVADVGYVKNKLTASYLAQEGVEMVRNIRDTDSIINNGGANAWNAFISHTSSCASLSIPCQIDGYTNPSEITISECTNILKNIDFGCPLYYDYDSQTQIGSGYYKYKTSGAGEFTRLIIVQNIGNEVRIISKVFWKKGNTTYHVSFKENLTNWQ